MQAQIVHHMPYHRIAGAGPLSLPGETRYIRSITGGEQARILVIGHREGDVNLVRQALDGLDVGIEWAANEAAAWTHLATRRYDLLTVLVPLPRADELSLCRRLRVVDARRPILVVDTSGAAAGSAEVPAAREAGANAYLAAPLAAGELRTRVAALLGRWDIGYRLTVPHALAPTVPMQRTRAGKPLLAALRHALQESTVPMTRRTRVALAAGLIVTGVAGDRIVRSLRPAPIGAVASALTTTTVARPRATAVKHAVAVANPSLAANAQKPAVTLGSGKTSTVTLVGAGTVDGLAVIRVNAEGLTPVHVTSGDSGAQAVLPIGSRAGLRQSANTRLI